MDYRKKGRNWPHHSAPAKAFGMIFGTYFFVSLTIASIPVSAYAYVDPVESVREILEEKSYEENVAIHGIELPEAPSTQDVEAVRALVEEENLDVDPLSYADYDKDSINPDDYIHELSANIIKDYVEYLEYDNVPFTTHFDRDYSKITGEDLLVMTKIVVSEIGNCTFEQQAATAGMCLNMLYDPDFPDTMFENAIAPGRFRESYGYAPWPEPSDKTRKAMELALSGIDFSCNAVSFYTPEYSSAEGCRVFEEYTTTTAIIPSKCEGETSVFACLNGKKEEALSTTKYIYSKYYDSAVIYYG